MFKILLFAFCISASAMEHKIAAIVGDHIITEYELDQKIRFTIFSQGMDKKINPREMYPYFINSIVENDLIISRLKQSGGIISDEDVQNSIRFMALNTKSTPEKIIQTATEEYGINKNSFFEFIKNDMLMQNMFWGPMANDVKISDEEIKKEANNKNLNSEDPKIIQEIKLSLTQKIIGQKIKQIVQSLRQQTFVEIKIR